MLMCLWVWRTHKRVMPALCRQWHYLHYDFHKNIQGKKKEKDELILHFKQEQAVLTYYKSTGIWIIFLLWFLMHFSNPHLLCSLSWLSLCTVSRIHTLPPARIPNLHVETSHLNSYLGIQFPKPQSLWKILLQVWHQIMYLTLLNTEIIIWSAPWLRQKYKLAWH